MEADIVFKILAVVSSLGLYMVSGIEITKPAYRGHKWLNDCILFSEQKTWLEARDVCTSLGGSIQNQKWDIVNWYIKTKAERYGWSVTDDVWLGIIKDKNSDKWYEVRESKCREKSFTLSGQDYSERQCAVLNMSVGSLNDPNMVYAGSCDARTLGFACYIYKGDIPKDVESYPMSEVVEKGSERYNWNTSSEEECAIKSFDKFTCYAATYFPEKGHCIAECTEMTTILENVTLVDSSVNATVLLRTHNKVSINRTLTTLSTSTNQYPCVVELSTKSSSNTISSADPSLLTQTDVDTYTLSHSGNTDDTSAQTDITTFTELSNVTKVTQMFSDTTESPSSCSCVCSTNSNNITDAELERKLMDIKKKLTVNKTSLSSTMRKKTSAPDDRISSASMVALGICVILALSMSVVAGDVGYVISFIKYLK